MKRLGFAACLLLCATEALCQRRNSHWMFRNHWISFVSGQPELVTEAPFATPSCTMSDPGTGELRVYVAHNGATQLVSADHQVLPTSPGFPTGNNSAWAQGSLFVPRPGHPDEAYFIAFMTAPPVPTIQRYGYRRMFVGEAGELPIVLDTDYTWFMDGACLKRMVVPHANGLDYWFVGQLYGTNTFQAHRITADGIELPVESQAGAIPLVDEYAGQLCPTVQGDRFVNVSEQWDWHSLAQDASHIELFGLDWATGAITHQFTFTDLGRVRGVEFSPSGRFLYVADWPLGLGLQAYSRRLFQYDLWADDVQASRVLLDSVYSGTSWALPSISALGLAPDGRIYMAREPFVPYLSVIEQPDLPAPACGFVLEGFNTGTPMNCLPYFMKRYHDDVSLSAANEVDAVAARVVPNPLSGHCELLVHGADGPCSVAWLDALGRTARMQQVVMAGGRAALDASGLSAGPYLLRAEFGDGQAAVIQRAWVHH